MKVVGEKRRNRWIEGLKKGGEGEEERTDGPWNRMTEGGGSTGRHKDWSKRGD